MKTILTTVFLILIQHLSFSQTDDSLLTKFIQQVDYSLYMDDGFIFNNDPISIPLDKIENNNYHKLAEKQLDLYIKNDEEFDSTQLTNLYDYGLKHNFIVEIAGFFNQDHKTNMNYLSVLYYHEIYSRFFDKPFKYGIAIKEYKKGYMCVFMVINESDPRLDPRKCTGMAYK